jgi:hypothetical protein
MLPMNYFTCDSSVLVFISAHKIRALKRQLNYKAAVLYLGGLGFESLPKYHLFAVGFFIAAMRMLVQRHRRWAYSVEKKMGWSELFIWKDPKGSGHGLYQGHIQAFFWKGLVELRNRHVW